MKELDISFATLQDESFLILTADLIFSSLKCANKVFLNFLTYFDGIIAVKLSWKK